MKMSETETKDHNWAERITNNFYDPVRWWTSKQPELNNKSPQELATRGDTSTVEALIKRQEDANRVIAETSPCPPY